VSRANINIRNIKNIGTGCETPMSEVRRALGLESMMGRLQAPVRGAARAMFLDDSGQSAHASFASPELGNAAATSGSSTTTALPAAVPRCVFIARGATEIVLRKNLVGIQA